MFTAEQHGVKVAPEPGKHAICPLCKGPVVAKCGEINVWHWAHLDLGDCDTWSESESGWHLRLKRDAQDMGWKTEVTVGNHRADIMTTDGLVIELQHSPISTEMINERECFYKRMVWVFDAQAAQKAGRFLIGFKDGYETFRWKHRRKSVGYCSAPVFLDLGETVFYVCKHYEDMRTGWGHLWPKDTLFYRLGEHGFLKPANWGPTGKFEGHERKVATGQTVRVKVPGGFVDVPLLKRPERAKADTRARLLQPESLVPLSSERFWRIDGDYYSENGGDYYHSENLCT